MGGSRESLRFGRFELRLYERELIAEGRDTGLGGRAIDVLVALAESPGRLVSKRELMDRVWPGLYVQENNLAAQVSALRRVVGDGVVATVPGRGYRFIAAIEGAGDPEPPLPPPPASAPETGLRTNLPADLPVLLGRADEAAALAAAVDAHRLVTVVGPGGIGKSLLVKHLLRERRGAYAQGVCWVDLSAVSDGDGVAGSVGAALGAGGDVGGGLDALLGAVAPLSMLLAIDNAEHLLADVAALCAALLRSAPELRLVVTSQASLRVAGECVFRVGPLALPPPDATPELASRHGAVALFAARAGALDRGFALDDAVAADVVAICAALDGVPLAIELAAARWPTLGSRGLRQALDDRLQLLAAPRDRLAPPRQQTLRAAMAWSHDLLGERERRVFRRLGVVAGSASLGFVRRMLGEGDAPWDVVDALDVLVDHSLICAESLAGGDEPRYRMWESARAFAREQLQQAGEADAMRRAHAVAMAATLDDAYREYFAGTIDVAAWLRQREAELDDAREALHWARAHGDAAIEMPIAATLLRALPSALHDERIGLAEACAERVGRLDDLALRERVWIELSCAFADTQKARARQAADAAVALTAALDAAAPDAAFRRYHALARAASAAAQAGDLAAAARLLGEAQALESPRWPAQRLLWATEAAQWLARMSHDTAGALRWGRRLVALDRERGGHAWLAVGNLIDAALAAGDAEAAARDAAALVAELTGTRREYSLAFARVLALAALLALDDLERARPAAVAAWQRAVAFSLQHAVAAYLALLAALEGRAAEAARLCGYARAQYQARNEAIEVNEARALQRAEDLAAAALGESERTALIAEGAMLRDGEIAGLASLS